MIQKRTSAWCISALPAREFVQKPFRGRAAAERRRVGTERARGRNCKPGHTQPGRGEDTVERSPCPFPVQPKDAMKAPSPGSARSAPRRPPRAQPPPWPSPPQPCPQRALLLLKGQRPARGSAGTHSPTPVHGLNGSRTHQRGACSSIKEQEKRA